MFILVSIFKVVEVLICHNCSQMFLLCHPADSAVNHQVSDSLLDFPSQASIHSLQDSGAEAMLLDQF